MKILALDIGSYSVKAVELDATFGRVELGDYTIERIVETELAGVAAATEPQAETEEAAKAPARQLLTPGQLAAVRRLIDARPIRYDRFVVNFPRAWVTTRLFHFPTKDRKAIQNSLTFELDDDIPFALSDVIYDFATLNTENAQTAVFTAVALKSDITMLVSELQMLGLDPDLISIETWGMGHLLKRAIPKDYEGRPICIVNAGCKQTSIHMYIGDNPVLSHISTCAGADITRAIAHAYNLSFDQAEKAKVDGSFVLTQTHLQGVGISEPLTDEQKQFAATIGDALSPLIREIKQTLMAYKSQYKMTPRAIFLTGGTSLIPNLALYLEEILRVPVFSFGYMSRVVGQTLQLSESSEAQISCATGLGLAAIKIDRNATINFRKEIFAKKGGIGTIDWKSYKRPLKYVALSLGFVYFNLIAQGIILSKRSSDQDARLERSIKSVVGAVSSSAINTYVSSPSTLKSAVNKEIAKYKDAQIAPSRAQTSALDILNRVSSSMPRDMVLDVSGFEIKDGKFKMSGVVDQVANSTRIAKALEESGILTDVAKDKAEEDPKLKKVRFEYSAKVADAKAADSKAEAKNVKTR
jgi:Tfp pilus assembly PilM family ATPase